MKKQKLERLNRIKKILDVKRKEDIKEFKKPKSRSISLWLNLINSKLPSTIRPKNNRELAGLFRFFKFKRGASETTHEGCFRRIIFYRYKGGFKDAKKNQ